MPTSTGTTRAGGAALGRGHGCLSQPGVIREKAARSWYLRKSGQSGESTGPGDAGWNQPSRLDSEYRGPRSTLASEELLGTVREARVSLRTPITCPKRAAWCWDPGGPGLPVTPGEPRAVTGVPSRRSSSGPEEEGFAARGRAPPPGSRRDNPGRQRLQLPRPYKAGAGPRRGRGCDRPASVLPAAGGR